jgi:hypothetical protein
MSARLRPLPNQAREHGDDALSLFALARVRLLPFAAGKTPSGRSLFPVESGLGPAGIGF